MKRFFSFLFFLIGVLCYLVLGYAVVERNFPKNPDFIGKSVATNACMQQHKQPAAIKFSELAIKLPLIPSKITNGVWETTKDGVSYLTSSPVPGEKGNSILYGHNFPDLLGKLPASKPGQEIEITYTDKTKKTFVIEYTSVVSPKQIDILNPTTDNRITIYTCTGFLDSERFVVVALLKENKKETAMNHL